MLKTPISKPATYYQNQTYRLERPDLKLVALANSLGAVIKVNGGK